MENKKIGFEQFATAAAVSVFSPISRLLPKSALETAGRACWLGPLLAFLPLLGICFAVRSLLKGEERGLFGALEATLGKCLGRIVAAIMFLWIIFYGGFLIRSGAERYLSAVYKNGKLWFFVITIAGSAMIAALGRLASTVRLAQLAARILGAAVAVLAVLGAADLKTQNLLPVNLAESGAIALSALPALNVGCSWVFLGFISGAVAPGGRGGKSIVKWAVYALLIMLAVTVLTVGILGPQVASSQQYPFFVLISNLKLFNIIERIEPMAVLLWMLTDFVFIALLMMSAGEAVHCLLPYPGRRGLTAACAAAMTASAFFAVGDIVTFAFISERLVPVVNLFFSAIFLPFLALIKNLKKRGKK